MHRGRSAGLDTITPPLPSPPIRALYLLHHGYYVYFSPTAAAKCWPPAFSGNIAQGAVWTRGWKPCCLSFLLAFNHIVGHGHQSIFFTKGCSVFADQRQTIYVWIDYYPKIIFSFLDFAGLCR